MSSAAIDASVRAEAAKHVGRSVPGVSLVVADADRVIAEYGFGNTDLADSTEMTPDTACNWFSMTKLVTATAAARLADQGRLDLDAPVAEIYEPVSALRPADRTQRITTRHLLAHSSGIANPLPLRWIHGASEPAPDPSELTIRQLERHRRLRFDPGSRASYTNLGYLVLGEVIARASGEPYQEHVRTHVLAPLGMARTDFTARDATTWATPYHRRRSATGVLLPLLVPRKILGSRQGRFRALHPFYVDGPPYGGLVGPASDAVRFLQAHLRDGELDGTRILSVDAARAMRTIAARGRRIEVGMGWFRRGKVRSSDFVEHLGGGVGFWTCLRIYPDRGVGVVVMGNSTSYDHNALVAAALR